MIEWVLAGAVLGALLGALAAWVYGGRLRAGAQQQATAAIAQRDAAQQELDRQRDATETLRQDLANARKEATAAMTQRDAERASHAERIADFKRLREEAEKSFKALAGDVLEQSNKSFLALAEENLGKSHAEADKTLKARQDAVDALIKPIKESLAKSEAANQEMERNREGAYKGVLEQIKMLGEGQTTLSSETGKLVNALRRPKTRGLWGEQQLTMTLEMAGMTEGVHYDKEHSIAGSEGGLLRPDVIVKLPDGKKIVIDAKTPLDAYLDALDADDDATQTAHLKRHARQVRSHFIQLGSKAYASALEGTPDFVVMFIPGEAFLSAALEQAPDLYQAALEKKVLLCTPMLLIALLKTIAYSWQRHEAANNAEKIIASARELHHRVKIFMDHMETMGKRLEAATRAFNTGMGSLESRILPEGRRLEALHAAGPAALPAAMLKVETQVREGRSSDESSSDD